MQTLAPKTPPRSQAIPAVVALTVITGIVAVVLTRAAGPLAVFEVESGTLANDAAIQIVTGASGGSVVQFSMGTAVNPTPTPKGTPAPGAKPTAANTGYSAGTVLSAYTGSDYNSTSGVTYDKVNFPAGLGGADHYVFTGDNVIFKNCRIGMGIWIEGDNVRLENCEIIGGVSINNSNTVVITKNNIHNWEDGLHITTESALVKNITFTYNYVHTPNPACGAHSDGVQLIGIDGLIATGNNIDMGPQFNLCGDPNPLNGTFQIKTDFNGILNRNLTISNNWLNGGGYTLRIYSCGTTTVTNNRFGRQFSFGPVDVTATGCLTDKSGNVYDDNNQAITF